MHCVATILVKKETGLIRLCSKKRRQWQSYAVSMTLCVAFPLFAVVPARAETPQSAIEKRRVFTERLDSLELEKQWLKRKGRSIEDLERATDLIKDSIVAIRTRIAAGEGGVADRKQTGEEVVAPVSRMSLLWRDWCSFLPKTIFDWIVVAITGLAVISGVVLIIGIFGFISRGMKRKKKAVSPLHDMFSGTEGTDLFKGISKVPQTPAESEEERINDIRRRAAWPDPGMRGENNNRSSSLPARPPFNGSGDNEVISAPLVPMEGRGPQEIKRQVECAARQGLDVQEISRRFHLSADQVSLILRVSRRNEGGGR